MKRKITSSVATALLSMLLFSSCIKNNVDAVGDAGSTWIKILEAPENALYFSPFTTIDTLSLFSVRKDANSEAMLKKASTVTLTSIPDYIDAYNDDNGTSFETMPDSIYTLLNSSFTKTSSGYTLAFASGDFAKEFNIALNGAKWDVSHTYALAFTVSTSDAGLTALSDQDTIIVTLAVKNQYDGTYDAEGYFYHPSSPRAVSATKEVKTAGPYSVTVDLGDLGGSGYKALITVDQTTNELTITAASGASGAPYTMFTSGLPSSDPGYTAAWDGSASCNNYYDPTTKSFHVRYGYWGSTGWRVTEEIITMQ